MLPAVTSAIASPPRASYREVLRSGEFRVVLASWTVSMLGNILSHVGLAVLVLDRTGSPLLSALTFALGFIPYVIGGSLFSAASDRYPPRAVLVAGDLASGALVAAMVIPGLPVWTLLLLTTATGVIAPVYGGARSAVLPDMVSAEAFPLARALLRMISMSSQIVGFGLGGALLIVLSPRGLLAVDAASFLVSAALLRWGTRARPARATQAARSLARESLAGLRAAFASPRLRPLLLLCWLPPTFAVVPEALSAPYAQRIGAPAYGVGLLLGAPAVGSVLGSLLVGSLLSAGARERLVLPLICFELVPLLGYAFRPGLFTAAALLVVVGLGSCYELGLDQRLLAALDDTNRGLVLAVSSSGLMLTQGIGFAAGGAAAEFLPIPVVVPAAGACGILTALVLAGSLRRRIRR